MKFLAEGEEEGAVDWRSSDMSSVWNHSNDVVSLHTQINSTRLSFMGLNRSG